MVTLSPFPFSGAAYYTLPHVWRDFFPESRGGREVTQKRGRAKSVLNQPPVIVSLHAIGWNRSPVVYTISGPSGV